MEKNVAAIEFGSKKLKLVIGYELEGKVYVIYAITKPYGHIIEAGKVVDEQLLLQAINEIKHFADPSVKIKFNISEVVVSLPPYGLEVFQTKQNTYCASEDSRISNYDLRNIYTLIKNGSAPLKNELIAIIPEKYLLDQGRSFLNLPLNEPSSSLTVFAKIHTLPESICKGVTDALTKSGISVKRAVVAPFAAAELLGTYEDLPSDYFLVDIGSNMTTVSLIGEKQLYDSRFFEWGGDRITERIIESFNINEADAEKYKVTYGIDNRAMNFKAPICVTDDGEGNEIKHYADELNAIIKGELDIFLSQLNSSIDELLKGYDASAKALPMIVIGGGSKLNGLIDYISPKVKSEAVIAVAPRSLGARNPTFTNCLGMILADAKYPNVYDETHPRVGQVTRDPVNN